MRGGIAGDLLGEGEEVLADLAAVEAKRLLLTLEHRGDVHPDVGVLAPVDVHLRDAVRLQPLPEQLRKGEAVARREGGRERGLGGGEVIRVARVEGGAVAERWSFG